MDFVKEAAKAITGMSVENAKKLEKEIREGIEAREQRRECACGTPCSNPVGHNAADRIILLQLLRYLY